MSKTHNGIEPINRKYNLYDFCSLIGKTRKTVGDWIKLNGAPYTKSDSAYIIDVAEMWEWHNERVKNTATLKYKNVDVEDIKVRKETAMAEMKEYELEIMKKNYLPRDLVEKVAFEKGKAVKDALSSVPDRLCGLLVGHKDEREVYKILSEEITSVLETLSLQEIMLDEEEDPDEGQI